MIRVQNLYKTFGRQPVLRGLTLEVATAEIMVIIGRSGGGKSVLLRHLIGLMQPDSGAILVDGVDITRLRGAALDRIRERFGVSATRYYQILNELLADPAAMAADPMLVRRLQRMRAARQRQRVARRLGLPE